VSRIAHALLKIYLAEQALVSDGDYKKIARMIPYA